MARQKPLPRFLCGILLPLFLLSACQAAEISSPEQNYQDEVAAYCKTYAKNEKIRFMKREKASAPDRVRELNVRARQFFNRILAQCMKEHSAPPPN